MSAQGERTDLGANAPKLPIAPLGAVPTFKLVQMRQLLRPWVLLMVQMRHHGRMDAVSTIVEEMP